VTDQNKGIVRREALPPSELRVPDPALKFRLERSVQPLDQQFMAQTRDWPKNPDPPGEGPSSNWVPINEHGRLAEDLKHFRLLAQVPRLACPTFVTAKMTRDDRGLTPQGVRRRPSAGCS